METEGVISAPPELPTVSPEAQQSTGIPGGQTLARSGRGSFLCTLGQTCARDEGQQLVQRTLQHAERNLSALPWNEVRRAVAGDGHFEVTEDLSTTIL